VTRRNDLWAAGSAVLCLLLVLSACKSPAGAPAYAAEQHDPGARFEALERAAWREVFHDPGTGDWRDRWLLDGLKAEVVNSDRGMAFHAGPDFADDASHAVLWTRASFAGDIRIDYRYTRLDDAVRAVNILYLHARGSGEPPFARDITAWRSRRTTPSMRLYYDHMHAYHISYAAFGLNNTDPENDYVRARRYMPDLGQGLEGTAMAPDYARTGLFRPGVTYRITVIHAGDDLFMRVRAGDVDRLMRWRTDTFAPLGEGRVGLRHMYTRSARYREIRISTLPSDREKP